MRWQSLGPNQENVYKKLLEKQAKVYHKLGDYERASSLLLDAVSWFGDATWGRVFFVFILAEH